MRCTRLGLSLFLVSFGAQAHAEAPVPVGPVENGAPEVEPAAPRVAEGPEAATPGVGAGPAATATAAITAPTTKAKPSIFRGSEISYRNWMTALTLDKSADLTYNPTWVMEVEFAPRVWLGKIFNIGATIGFAHELTNADDTTKRGETQLADIGLRFGASNFAQIPGAKIDLSASLGVTLPTSLASQGDTLIMGLAPSLRLSRTFDVLDGLTIGYSLRFTKLFHQYTTSATDTPLIPGCRGDSCDRFLTTGGRNVSWRVSNGFDVSLGITDWVDFAASFAVVVSRLYDGLDDERVSLTTIAPTDNRYAFVGDLGFSFHPWKPLDIGIGATSVNPQLSPDGQRYAPFINRFTALYLDLRLDVAALVADIVKE